MSVAALLVQVAMTGAVLSVPALPERVAALLAPELRDILVRPVTEVDPLARERVASASAGPRCAATPPRSRCHGSPPARSRSWPAPRR